MPYKIDPIDGSITATTWEEALQIARKIRHDQIRLTKPQPSASSAPSLFDATGSRDDNGIAMLAVLAKAGVDGMTTSEVSESIAVSTRGISGVFQSVQKMVKERIEGHSFKLGDVVWKTDKRGIFRWHADPDRLREIGLA